MKVSMDRFEAAVEQALGEIPEAFWKFMENTEFVVAPRHADGLLGLYEGGTALFSGEDYPERVTVYKDAHERACDTYDELVAEVRRTILHEVGHHFGMEEDELPY